MNIFIFRRDLRIYDNTGLNYLISKKKPIILLFIFEPKQIDKQENNYFSNNSVNFLYNSLKELDVTINKNINYFYGDTIKIIDLILKKYNINELVVNEDYTPFSIKRDNRIEEICKKNKVLFKSFEDITLGNFKIIKTKAGSAYKKFKYFYKKTIEQVIRKPIIKNQSIKFIKIDFKSYKVNLDWLLTKFNKNKYLIEKGGRRNGLRKLLNAELLLNKYKENRMYPLVNKKHPTTLLSPYLKYGILSIREVYNSFINKVNKNHEIIRQLIWRDFYYNLIYFYPNSFINKTPSIINDIVWPNNKKKFKKWCEGKTGYPFIDAGMRQLNLMGYMPNRLRLCCSCFLIKNLHIDWKWGERYFAQNLIDYDPAQNNGNWQWVSSTGYETQAYYRYLNPITDLEKYDSKCEYIKKYILELRGVSNNIIKKWHLKQPSNINYSKPICNFIKSIDKYKKNVKLLMEIED